jgi:hypothetical protein
MRRTDPRLHCCIEDLTYDFRTREGQIHFPRLNCCDMSGCIRLFQGIDPRVQAIQTFNGDGPDTRYTLTGGRWVAQTPSRRCLA